MKQTRFFLVYLILLIVQICIFNYFRLSQFVVLSILPVMVLLIPIRNSTTTAMIIAFLSGLAVDFLSDGLLGLNTMALVPVAFARNGIIRLVCGSEIFAREEDITIPKQGLWNMSIAITMALGLYLLIYVWADAAGTRPFWFCLARFGASLLASALVSLFAADILATDRTSGSRR